MAIKLEEHKFFEYQRKMEVVPYSIAKKAIEEAREDAINTKLDQIQEALNSLTNPLNKND